MIQRLSRLLPLREKGKRSRNGPGRWKRTIFVSGYPDEAINLKSLLPEGVVFLQEPVSPADLLAAIRRILDGECRVDGGLP